MTPEKTVPWADSRSPIDEFPELLLDEHLPLLKVVIWVILIGSTLFAALLIASPHEYLRRIYATLGLIALASAAYIVLRYRGSVAAVRLLAIGTWLLATYASFVGEGVRTPVLLAYPVTLVFSGWLLGPRYCLVLFAMSCGAVVAMAFGQDAGVIGTATLVPPLVVAVAHLIVLTISAVMTLYLLRVFRKRYSEERRLNSGLQASQMRLEMALSGGDLGLWDWHIPSNVVLYSERWYAMLGLPMGDGELDLDSWFNLIHPDDLVVVREMLDSHLKGKTPAYECEHRIRHSDGHWLWLLDRGKVVQLDKEGAPVRAVGTSMDITERKQGEAELDQHRHHLEQLVFARTTELAHSRDAAEAANRAKSIFLATMSHELRTPMNGIMGMTDLALRRATDPQQIDWLNKGKGSAQRLLAIINDILDISKMEAEQLTLEENDFSLAQVIDGALRPQDEAARAKGLSLSATIDPALPDMLRGDAERLGQVLTNFISNAVKFSERGQITVRGNVAEEDSQGVLLRIEVSDQGVGINPEDQARLFQAFIQADGSSTRKYGGTGLGLIICKRLALLMGGEVGADSTPGVGSTFWFTARLQRAHGTLPADKARSSEVMRQQMPDSAEALAPDPGRAMVVLKQLEPLLASDNTRAADLFEANRPLLLATLGAEAVQLERQVAAFDYPGALVTVREMLRKAAKT